MRLPVVLHDSGALERGAHALSSRRSTAFSKASRGSGQRPARPQRQGLGRRSEPGPERPGQQEGKPGGQRRAASEGAVKVALDEAAREQDQDQDQAQPLEQPLEQALEQSRGREASVARAASERSPAEPGTRDSSPRNPLGKASSSGGAVGSAKPRAAARPPGPSAASRPGDAGTRARGVASQPRPPRPPAPARTPARTPARPPVKPNSVAAAPADDPPEEPPAKPPAPQEEPPARQDAQTKAAAAPETADKPPRRTRREAGATSSSSVPELSSYQSDSSSLDFSESTTEVTCRWPPHRPSLRLLRHCWRLSHLGC